MHAFPVSRTLLGTALAVSAAGAQAADFQFTGNLVYNTDRVHVTFDLGSAGEVGLWTDSWNGALPMDGGRSNAHGRSANPAPRHAQA